MTVRRASWSAIPLLALVISALGPVTAMAHGTEQTGERLAKIGPAADFSLIAEDGSAFSSAELRGKVVALNFVFTRCTDVCPIATAKMVQIQHSLGEHFGRDVYFVTVSVEPEHDTPRVLDAYARALGCDPAGWSFLTGTPAAVRDVARAYGVYYEKPSGEQSSDDGSSGGRRSGGEVEHNLLMSLIDRDGTLRVQYMGERFDPAELLQDLRGLMAEGRTR